MMAIRAWRARVTARESHGAASRCAFFFVSAELTAQSSLGLGGAYVPRGIAALDRQRQLRLVSPTERTQLGFARPQHHRLGVAGLRAAGLGRRKRGNARADAHRQPQAEVGTLVARDKRANATRLQEALERALVQRRMQTRCLRVAGRRWLLRGRR